MFVNRITIGAYTLPLIGQATYERTDDWSSGQLVRKQTLTARLSLNTRTTWKGFPHHQPADTLSTDPRHVIGHSITLHTICHKAIELYKAQELPLPLLTLQEQRGKAGESSHFLLTITRTTLP